MTQTTVEPITLDHVRQAAEWALGAKERSCPIDGLSRRYNQESWDCGTSCCMWGAASIIAGQGVTTRGPSTAWASQSISHTLAAGIMKSGETSPEQMLSLLDPNNLSHSNLAFASVVCANLARSFLAGAKLSGINLTGTNLTGANLADADLTDAKLSGINLTGADLTDAKLSGINLTGANLTGANLADADLTDAKLSGINLTGANLTGANLSGAYLYIGNCKFVGV